MSLYKRCECSNPKWSKCEHLYSYKFMFARKVVFGSTKTSSAKVAADLERAHRNRLVQERGGLVDASVADKAWTLDELVKRYGAHYLQQHPRTAKKYGLRVLGKFRDALGGSTLITSVTAFRIMRWRNRRIGRREQQADGRRGRVLSRQTAQVQMGTVAGMFAQALEWKADSGLKTNPFDQVQWFRNVDKKKPHTATDADLALLNEAPPLVRVLCRMTATSLGRLMELALVRPDDLQPRTNRIIVRRKGGKEQPLPVMPAQMRELEALVVDKAQPFVLSQLFAERGLSTEPEDGQTEEQALDRLGMRLSTIISDWWTSVGRPNFTHHTMRHTGITVMLEAGTNPLVIKELAGWESLDQLERYGHVRDAEVAKALAATTAALSAKLGTELGTGSEAEVVSR